MNLTDELPAGRAVQEIPLRQQKRRFVQFAVTADRAARDQAIRLQRDGPLLHTLIPSTRNSIDRDPPQPVRVAIATTLLDAADSPGARDDHGPDATDGIPVRQIWHSCV